MYLRALLNAPLASQNIAAAVFVRTVALCAAIAFFVLAAHNLYFGEYQNWVEVQAKVVDNQAHSSDPVVYTPILTYTVKGHEYRNEDGYVATESQYAVGRELSILVNPADPSQINQTNRSRLWIMISLGVLLLPFLRIGVKTVIELINLSSTA